MTELKGTKALLLAEGCKVSKEKKAAERRLAQIKKELGLKKAGTYTNAAGDELNIAEIDNYSEIDPKKVVDYLRRNKMVTRFPEVVKVQLTPLKKLVPESVIEKWRYALDSTMRWTWK